jgi:hypothetical protein
MLKTQTLDVLNILMNFSSPLDSLTNKVGHQSHHLVPFRQRSEQPYYSRTQNLRDELDITVVHRIVVMIQTNDKSGFAISPVLKSHAISVVKQVFYNFNLFILRTAFKIKRAFKEGTYVCYA